MKVPTGTLSVDFETRSTVDLRKTGVYPYAAHPDTDILMMAWAIDDGPVSLWRRGEAPPLTVVRHVEQGGHGCLRAWNAQFERVMWNECLSPRYGFPKTTRAMWECTAAEARAVALPRHLKEAARALGSPEQKDDDGHALMLQMCKPRRPRKGEDPEGTYWFEDDERMHRLGAYCRQDVRTERDVANRIRRLTDYERRVYLLDQRINDRGALLDIPLIEAAASLAEKGTKDANNELNALTNGEVTRVTQAARLKSWVSERLDVPPADLRKDTVRDLLAGDLPDEVREALQIRRVAGLSSVAKLNSMLRVRGADDRARGLLMYHGAATGRWAGRLIQPQNFPRGEVADVESYIPAVLSKNVYAFGEQPILPVLSGLLRGMLRASPGHRLLAGDWGQIEARVVNWLAGEPYEENEYELMASRIFNTPLSEVTKEQRQIGKVCVLGAGYQMGPKRYVATVREWTGQVISEGLGRRAIDTYRASKPGIPRYWRDVEEAAMSAVRTPGRVTSVGDVRYVKRGRWLWCVLPSNRPIGYVDPSLVTEDTDWGPKTGLRYWSVNGYTKKWTPHSAYGGLLTENITQAVARDIMADAMLRLDAEGYPIILTVHDEVVADVPEGRGSLTEFEEIMLTLPQWAEGCTVAVDGWEGERYRK